MEENGGGGENSQDELLQMLILKLPSSEGQELLIKALERVKNDDVFREVLGAGMKMYSSNPDQENQTSVGNDDKTHEQGQPTDANNIDPPGETHSSLNMPAGGTTEQKHQSEDLTKRTYSKSSTEPSSSSTGEAAASISAVNETSAEMKTTAASDLFGEEYNMNNTKRGRAIIFSHKYFSDNTLSDREDTDIDQEKLKCVFEQLQFTVVVHKGKTYHEICVILEALSLEDHSDEDCLIVAVLTHGINNFLMASDSAYNADMLWTTFTGERCPTLAGKPKLFFIEACRGDRFDRGTMVDSGALAGNTYKIPSCADLLIMNSTVEGFGTWTYTGEESWFISALCEVLSYNDGSEDLFTLLLKVSAEMAFEYESHNPKNPDLHNCKQVPCLRSTLIRKAFFKPKVLRQRLQPDENTEDSFQPYRHARKIPSPLLKYGNENKTHCLQGHAVIFNNESFVDTQLSTRRGSEIDVDRLKHMLPSLGFTMDIYHDTKIAQMRLILSNLAKEDHSKRDCLLVTILTHGSSNGILHASDFPFHEEELWKPFIGDICPSLAGKPKMFLIQACRGEKTDPGATLKHKMELDSGSRRVRTPTHADFLLCYSTFEGYASFRDPDDGTWFIRILCDELQQQSDDIRFLDVLRRVSQRVALEFVFCNTSYILHDGKKQIPSIYSTLTKDIILAKTDNGYVRCKELPRDPVSQNNEDPIPIEDLIVTAKPIWSQPNHQFAYTMDFKKRGQAIIFNHENFFNEKTRGGFAEDVNKLEHTLQELQFETKVYKDKCRNDVIKIIEEVAKADHSDSDCLVVCVLTHGYDRKHLWVKDGVYHEDSIWSPFVENDNSSLKGKPKIFIIQACRGHTIYRDIQPGQLESDRTERRELSPPDSLIVYSSCLECGSFQYKIKGTFFIRTLSSELLEGYESLGLFQILTRTTRRLDVHFNGYPKKSREEQWLDIDSTLTGDVYFRRKTFD